jgi:hypothetical protein
VPMVPPWVEDVPPESEESTDSPQHANTPPQDDVPSSPQQPVPLAPPRRFRDARRSLGNFARTGDVGDLRRGLAHYVTQGYGGGSTFARRIGGTATTAGRLGGVLQTGLRPDGTALQDQLLAGATDANAVMDAIVEAVRPTDGTQDTEASRSSVRDALSDLLERFPAADLLALTDAQRFFVIERYSALDIYKRFMLDVGRTIIDKAGNPTAGLSRLKQVRSFIAETVAASFKVLRDRGKPMTTSNIVSVTRQALAEAISVFEEYL